MANIQERRDKTGKLVSYSVRVFRGRGADGKQLKPYTATFEVQPTWTEKKRKKESRGFRRDLREAMQGRNCHRHAPDLPRVCRICDLAQGADGRKA